MKNEFLDNPLIDLSFPCRDTLLPYYRKHEYQGEKNLTYDKIFKIMGLPDKTVPEKEKVDFLRYILENDLFLLIYFCLGRRDINGYNAPFLVKQCNLVQDGPMTDTVDLWARGHYKSTIITQGLSLQRLLKIPDHTIGIFSYNQKLAISFVRPVKYALETNPLVHYLWPDRVWDSPTKDAPAWSYDKGFVLKRSSESNTCSLEACGLVEAMPTGKHFNDRVYDDVITEKTVYTPEQMERAKDAFQMSDNLSSRNGKQRIVGTIYDHGDYYSDLIRQRDDGTYNWNIRIFPWFDRSYYLKTKGVKKPIFFSAEEIKKKQKVQGPYIFACQMELDPSNEELQEFKLSWLQWYYELPTNLNLYLIVDPANEKHKKSDWTVFALLGIDELSNRYLIDMVRDKMNLNERWLTCKAFVKMYPESNVFYERYGLQADGQHFQHRMKETGFYFSFREFGGNVPKKHRCQRLQPVLKNGKFWLPELGIIYQGEDLVQTFINHELRPFPFPVSWDMLDAISRIEDPEINATPPMSTSGRRSIEAIRNEFLEIEDAAGW